MEVKIDTKEKFHVLTILNGSLTANMTAAMGECLVPYLQNDVKNVILNLGAVQELSVEAGQTLARIQQEFYEKGASCVICEVRPSVEAALDQMELLDLMNITPTESEAWDIVQMEEIERELLDE